MPIHITIRVAQRTDAKAVKDCVVAAYHQYIPRIGKPPGPMLDDFAKVIARHTVFVAEEKGEVVGVLVLLQQESNMLLDNVAVHPDSQGKGVGRQLLKLAESETRKRGCVSLELYTHECMTENIALYQRNGYRETARRIERGYHRVYMEKLLS